MADVRFTPEFVLQIAFKAYKFNRSLSPERFDDGAKAVDEMARKVLFTALKSPEMYACPPRVLGEIAAGIYKLHRSGRVVVNDIPVGLNAEELEIDEAAKQILKRFLSAR